MSEVVTDSKHCELTNLTKSCILHSLHVLLKQDRQPRSPDKVQKFCRDLCERVLQSNSKDKRSLFFASVPGVSLEEPLQIDANEFEKGLLTAKDIFPKFEQKLVECIQLSGEPVSDFDHDAIFKICWKVYRIEARPDNVVTKFSSEYPASDDCMYYLWLIFNAILSPGDSFDAKIPVRCLDGVMRRVFDLCSHECSRDELVYNSSSEMLEYPEYLKAIANYNAKFDLKKTLTTEVIHDLKDEIVDAVLKKSYITKKGHKLRTWKRRWFVLKKTIMRYYESKEKLVLKGQMVINENTQVGERDDIGRRMHCFEVICGLTGKPFEMSADDEKSRHEWILAIRKAISLAKILSGSEDKEMREHSSKNPNLSNFYLIKFGVSQSIIPKWEGGIKQVIDGSQSVGNFSDSGSDDDDDSITSKVSPEGPTPGSVASTSSAVQGDSMFIRDNTNNTETKCGSASKSLTLPQKGSSSPAYNRRQRFRSKPASEMSLMSTCDQAPSIDSTRVTESTAINGVKEVNADSVVSDNTSGPVESCIPAESTKASVSQYEPVADNGDSGPYYYGPEDAPSAAESVRRPHAQTFLDKMQSLAFDTGAVPDFEESYCDL